MFVWNTVAALDPHAAVQYSMPPSELERPPACFRVLACDELLRNILSYLTEPKVDDLDAGRATLASLATVCKVVSPLAISTLWERLEHIQPLISLCDSLPVTDAPPISLPPRLQAYASHVRAIEIDSGTIPTPLIPGPNAPVFDNLRRLHWVVPHKAQIQAFAGFIVPTLTELRVDITSDPSAAGDCWNVEVAASLLDALDVVIRRCTSLTALELIWVDGPFLPAASAIAESLSSLRSLRTVSVTANILASPKALYALSQLPYLRHFEVSHFADVYPERLGLAAVNNGFDALQTLSLAGPHPLIHELLDHMPTCTAHHCAVSLRERSTKRLQERVVEDIARRLGASLDSLSLSFPSDVYISDLQTFLPLSVDLFSTLRMFNLVDVRLAWVDAHKVTDELCRDLARSWPCLRVLHLRPVAMVQAPPASMATLRGLRHFAESCLNLSDIVIQVNASGEHWAAEAQTISTRRLSKTLSLDLTTSLVTSPESVAVYLRRCFQSFLSVRFSRTEARICGQGARISAWDQLCGILMSDEFS
ncbi:hypothetical protein BD414DRAFT_198703 [Trametes punicea]|nr:hypothetical protein BD414DRAFT_198703 [Trametes punicea]